MAADNPKQILLMALAAGSTTAVAWVASNLLDGAEQRGYNRAKSEINDEYNKAIVKAITCCAHYDVCCESAGADSTER